MTYQQTATYIDLGGWAYVLYVGLGAMLGVTIYLWIGGRLPMVARLPLALGAVLLIVGTLSMNGTKAFPEVDKAAIAANVAKKYSLSDVVYVDPSRKNQRNRIEGTTSGRHVMYDYREEYPSYEPMLSPSSLDPDAPSPDSLIRAGAR